MKKTLKILAAASLLAPVGAVPVTAHHSFAMFDLQKTITLKGKVARFKWQNPHSWIQVDVNKKGGGSERWAIEMTSPNNLALAGWRRSTLRNGDQVTLFVNPLRNGSKGGNYSGVILANGSTMGEVKK